MGTVVAIRPVEFDVQADDAISEMTNCMMAPVFAIAKAMEANFEAEGLPPWKSVRITVHVSEQLRAALDAEGAFDLILQYDKPG